MERIGIYGGTFNPPHVGHIRAAEYAIEELKLQKLLLIPSYVAPHKELPADSPTPRQRAHMLEAAMGEKMEVCTIELNRGGISFTFETVEALSQMYSDKELILLMGTDMFLSFLQWKEPLRIINRVSIGVFCRGEADERERINRQKENLESYGARIYLIDNPVTHISSTQLRRLIAFGCTGGYLPEKVEHYILENGLYGVSQNCRNLSLAELEQVVVRLLKPERVAHVLGCRDMAAELAGIWGADKTDAARAGLLHDITKALDGQLQLTLCRQYGIILDNFSLENPKTLHALTGSLVAERVFGEKKEIVEAIRYHTTGRADMTKLEKILYIADYVEPNRTFCGVEKLRALAYRDLDQALKLGLEMTLSQLQERGERISPLSAEAFAFLQQTGV